MTASKWADTLNLDNLVPYTHPSAAWSDRHSNIALSWTRPDEIGLQNLHALVGWGGTLLTENTLGWQLIENGSPLPLTLQERNYRPDKVVEVDQGAALTLSATVVYPRRNALAVQFELTNQSDQDRQLTVEFDYPGKGVAPDWQGVFPLPVLTEKHFFAPGPGHCVSLEDEPQGCWSTLFWHLEHGRNITWVRDYAAGMPHTSLEMTCISDLHSRQLHLGVGSTASFVLTMAFGFNRGKARRLYEKSNRKVNNGKWTVAEETRRIRKLLNQAPPLPPKYAAEERYARMYAHAITSLNSLYIRGEGGLTGDKSIPWTTKDKLAIAFFWDTAFSCAAACEFNSQAARDALEAFCDNISPRGGLPGTLCDTHRAGEGQAPVMSWAAWVVYQQSPDADWLRRIYPALGSYYRFWCKYHSSKRGLPVYYNAGQAGDNDVRWDAVYDRVQGNEPLFDVESPDLLAFFVTELRCLAGMALELGLPGEADQWEQEADRLAQQVVDYFYFPEDAMFLDVREGTREKFTGTKAPFLFIPLRAQVPLPSEEVQRVVEGHMLNPDEFYKEMPFPSVSFDNPKYDPNGYWRGRIWPHVVYWMIQTLWVTGYHAEAEETAERLLRLFERTPWIHENYNSALGTAWDPDEIIGFPEYNWSFAALILILLERYKQPLQP